MPTLANTVPPSLVDELADLKRRLSAIERAPTPQAKFDRYPAVEREPQPRLPAPGNVWSSFSVANLTGLAFDRVEVKFLTDKLMPGKREAETRIAVFRHANDGKTREIVSASTVLNLAGTPAVQTGSVCWRWSHGIPYGWDYEDENTIYTLELQHRYKVGPEKLKGVTSFVASAPEGTSINDLRTVGVEEHPPGSGKWWWGIQHRDPGPWAPRFVTVPNADDGAYRLSPMHYCVGLPADRLPDGTPYGWAALLGVNGTWGRAGDITEPYAKI